MRRLPYLCLTLGAVLGGVCPGANVAFALAAGSGGRVETATAVWIGATLAFGVGGALAGLLAGNYFSGRPAPRRIDLAIAVVAGLVAGGIGYRWVIRLLEIDPL